MAAALGWHPSKRNDCNRCWNAMNMPATPSSKHAGACMPRSPSACTLRTHCAADESHHQLEFLGRTSIPAAGVPSTEPLAAVPPSSRVVTSPVRCCPCCPGRKRMPRRRPTWPPRPAARRAASGARLGRWERAATRRTRSSAGSPCRTSCPSLWSCSSSRRAVVGAALPRRRGLLLPTGPPQPVGRQLLPAIEPCRT